MPQDSHQGALILNVNDNQGARYMVTRLLERAGFRVIDAVSGQDALTIISREKPDLVVLDLRLPDIDGFEVCRRIRNDPSAQSVKVVHTSATFVSTDIKVQSLDGGADAYLAQPFEVEELVATVKSLLRLKDTEEALRRTAERLRDVDRKKDEFLAMLAHELRNPVAVISATLPNLERHATQAEIQERARLVLERQTRQLSRIIDDLLDVARVTQGKVELKLADVELVGLVRQVTEDAQRAKMGPRKQTLRIAVPDRKVYVRGDVARLEQVFANLLDNASKYTPEGGEVSATLELVPGSTGERARLTIRDNGAGMTAETIPTVFGLFTQGEVPLARSQGGLGVGLTLARTLIDLHGGEISAASEGPSRGSTFVVSLPTILPSVKEASDGESKMSVPTGAGRRVLVVEDNADLQEMVAMCLEDWGHQVTCESDGESGLSRALEMEPDVGLVDIGLPGIDGYELARRLRNHDRGQRMLLVAMTGYGAPEQRARALDAGFDLVLMKPVDPRRLRDLLDTPPDELRVH